MPSRRGGKRGEKRSGIADRVGGAQAIKVEEACLVR